MPYALSHLPQLELWAGQLGRRPRRGHAGTSSWPSGSGQTAQLRQANFNLALVAAHRGDERAAEVLAEELLAEAWRTATLWSEASARGLLGW